MKRQNARKDLSSVAQLMHTINHIKARKEKKKIHLSFGQSAFLSVSQLWIGGNLNWVDITSAWRPRRSLTNCWRRTEKQFHCQIDGKHRKTPGCRVNWHHWCSSKPWTPLTHQPWFALCFLVAIITIEGEETNHPIEKKITVLLSYNERQQPFGWWWCHIEGDNFISSGRGDLLWFLFPAGLMVWLTKQRHKELFTQFPKIYILVTKVDKLAI